MTVIAIAEGMLAKGLASLQSECRKGSVKDARAIAYLSVLCAGLLSDVLQSKDCPPGQAAIDNAARQAPAWLIAYPALDDGRTNRINDPLPSELKDSLNINGRSLRATKKSRPERPGVKTFLEEKRD